LRSQIEKRNKISQEGRMKHCAICGRKIRKYGLCTKCFKQWGNKEEWVKELIKLQYSFDTKKCNFEIPFSNLNINEIYPID